jgi:hypothetical protein
MWHAYGTPILNSAGTGYDYMPTKLQGCCGVGELRHFSDELEGQLYSNHSKPISSFTLGPYTGIFVCTYTKKQAEDGLEAEINKFHTLLYQTDFIINTSPMATEDGVRGGVRTAMYKWGKEV